MEELPRRGTPRLSSADTLGTALQVDSHAQGRLASSSVFPKEGFSETNQFRSEKTAGIVLRVEASAESSSVNESCKCIQDPGGSWLSQREARELGERRGAHANVITGERCCCSAFTRLLSTSHSPDGRRLLIAGRRSTDCEWVDARVDVDRQRSNGTSLTFQNYRLSAFGEHLCMLIPVCWQHSPVCNLPAPHWRGRTSSRLGFALTDYCHSDHLGSLDQLEVAPAGSCSGT